MRKPGRLSPRNGVLAVAAMSAMLLATACEAEITHGEESTTVSLNPNSTEENDAEAPEQEGEPAAEEASTQQPDTDEAPDTDTTENAALMLVMDASGSMNEADLDGGQTRLAAAKDALRGVVASIPGDTNVGLRVFGSTVSGDREAGCEDTELIQPVGPLDREAMLSAIDEFEAVGWTPIGYALQQAANDLPSDGPRSIILVSDGEETCAPPPPCEVAADLAEQGIDLTIHTVGFALKDNDQARQELSCIADAARGEFRDVDDAAELADTLREVTARERRRMEAAGDPLEGAPVPQRANTGELNTTYVDTVLGNELNFYRFEVPSGSRIRGYAVLTNDAGVSCGSTEARVALSDHTGSPRSWFTGRHQIEGNWGYAWVATGEGIWRQDDVWLGLRLTTDSEECHSTEFTVEIQVETVG
jgi:hypothetical protein